MTAGRSWVALRPGVRGPLKARTDHHENHRTPVSSFLASQVPPTKQTQAILYFSWSWNMFSYYSNLSTLKSSLDQCYVFPGGEADPGAPSLLPPPSQHPCLIHYLPAPPNLSPLSVRCRLPQQVGPQPIPPQQSERRAAGLGWLPASPWYWEGGRGSRRGGRTPLPKPSLWRRWWRSGPPRSSR